MEQQPQIVTQQPGMFCCLHTIFAFCVVTAGDQSETFHERQHINNSLNLTKLQHIRKNQEFQDYLSFPCKIKSKLVILKMYRWGIRKSWKVRSNVSSEGPSLASHRSKQLCSKRLTSHSVYRQCTMNILNLYLYFNTAYAAHDFTANTTLIHSFGC